MPKLYIPTIMRKNAGGNATLQLSGRTVSDVFAHFVATYPAVRAQLLDESGRVQPHINVFVNEDDIRYLSGVDTALDERDEVTVIPAMAGGA
jgi:molybdopterin converting factor small subunit